MRTIHASRLRPGGRHFFLSGLRSDLTGFLAAILCHPTEPLRFKPPIVPLCAYSNLAVALLRIMADFIAEVHRSIVLIHSKTIDWRTKRWMTGIQREERTSIPLYPVDDRREMLSIFQGRPGVPHRLELDVKLYAVLTGLSWTISPSLTSRRGTLTGPS